MVLAAAAAVLALGAAGSAQGQTLATHRLPAVLAMEAVAAADADEACARAGLDKIRDRVR
jgi:hypothetical protein